MKAVLLDGSQAHDTTGERVSSALTAQLEAEGWEVEHVVVRDKLIGSCAGDFFCWVRTPGVCQINDDNRAIAASLATCDLAVYLTPVTFGGYSAMLKRMVDHHIQNISPFFTQIDGETHHFKRYKRTPALLAVGWVDAPDPAAETIFRHLVQRNAINWHAKPCVSDVVPASVSNGELAASVQGWLADVQQGRSSPRVALVGGRGAAGAAGDVESPEQIRRAVLLVGSPRMRKSTSNSLGAYLHDVLGDQAIESETIYLHTALRSPQQTQALLEAVDAADLVTLSFPLYVDSLPAPVIDALERIAAHRQDLDPSRRQLFAALVNSGFPEAGQMSTAQAICATFARQAGFSWAGSLALGGGGMINGAPLAGARGPAALVRRALDLAASALSQGQAIQPAAQEPLRKLVLPGWAYRLMGGLSWVLLALKYKAVGKLWRRPYRVRAA